MKHQDILDRIKTHFGTRLLDTTSFRDELTLHFAKDTIHEACLFCRDKLDFEMLVDITSIDNSGEEPRFTLAYELYSLSHHLYLRLKCTTSEDACSVPTITDIWPTANWHEREIYDMMGIRFDGHPDLRRILMWEGYPYHPLRKEFPLGGKPSEMPDVAFSDAAPLEGGPFVASSDKSIVKREPRSRSPVTEP